jgi:hypothetical protein
MNKEPPLRGRGSVAGKFNPHPQKCIILKTDRLQDLKLEALTAPECN